MNQAAAMDRDETAEDARHPERNQRLRQGASRSQDPLQRGSVNVLHREPGSALVGDAGVVHLHDERTANRSGGPGLLSEALVGRIVRVFGSAEHLDRGVERGDGYVFCPVYVGESPRPDFFDDVISFA